MNKITLVPAIARKLGDLVLDGVVGTATGNQIIDQRIVAEVDNQMKGYQFYCYQGQAFNQALTIVANIVGSLNFTVAPSFATIPTVGDKYLITKRFGYNDYSSAIDEAVRRSLQLTLIPFSATLSLVPTQYEYAIPTGFKFIHELHIVPSGSTDYALENAYPLDRRAWSVSKNPSGTYTLYLDTRFFSPDWHDCDAVIIRGQRIPSSLTTPTTNAEVDDNFLIAYSAQVLSSRLIDEGQAWLQKFLAYKMEADKLESAIFSYPRASAVEII